MSSDIRIVFATTALGMGFDVVACHIIILYGSPRSKLDLVQEIGRQGRESSNSRNITAQFLSIKKCQQGSQDSLHNKYLQKTGYDDEATILIKEYSFNLEEDQNKEEGKKEELEENKNEENDGKTLEENKNEENDGKNLEENKNEENDGKNLEENKNEENDGKILEVNKNEENDGKNP
ncbi:recQ [Mytilus edulis]|uniref:DNA 3'-5' helicase n=1 Tax=Mytilus edulis TaxID=6550 RepID=A0A8S3UGK7_MYTED|nr:recQ [Mytilus edulis]